MVLNLGGWGPNAAKTPLTCLKESFVRKRSGTTNLDDDDDDGLSLQEDSDGDGYISCLQVLLALKNIVPPELLSDEEEIYVYRVRFHPISTHANTNNHSHTDTHCSPTMPQSEPPINTSFIKVAIFFSRKRGAKL